MGLQPLEFTDCLSDSPFFREKLHAHEKELDHTSQVIKTLIKDVKDILSAAKNLSKAQRNFASNMINFKFECIGTSQTEDEKVIAASLKEFGNLINGIEDERERMFERAYDQFIVPLETFRKEQIGGAKESKKKFDKHTAKFCQSLERHVNLTTKKNENILQENLSLNGVAHLSAIQVADAGIEMEQRSFQQSSLQYVFTLQEVQERKKFEFVETILGFMYGWLTFYHQGHEVAKDFKPFMTDLQMRLQKTRENYNATRAETETLMHKMLEMRKLKPQDSGSLFKNCTMQGYLFLMEKKAFATTWTKHYCQYHKENNMLTMFPYTQATGKITGREVLVLKSCVRRPSDSIEKRFCFDITAEDRPGLFTFQALSEEDRKYWMDAMDGKEPNYSVPCGRPTKPEETSLDDVGFAFVKKCISVLENRGLEDQGLYRLVGVTSKVNKLNQMGLDRRKFEKICFDDPLNFENKTITSAIKTYFRNLPEPLMTFNLHGEFIKAAKLENRIDRINGIHHLIHRLPSTNFEMLDIVIKHLCNVASKSEKNLMTVSNLGVCFGPTLFRPEEESVAAIMDIKFCNIVVEILIENHDKIFKISPVKEEHPITKCDDNQKSLLSVNVQPLQSVVQNSPPILSSVQPVTQTVITSYHTEVPKNVIPHGISSPVSLPHQIPIAPARHKSGVMKPLVIFNPAGPESAVQGSNSSSSTESLCSRPPRECNNHSSSNSSPQTSGKISHLSSTGKPSESKLSHSSDSSPNSLATESSNIRKARTLYHCDGDNESELSFVPNEIIIGVRQSREPGWLEGTLNGKTGLIPENYVELLP